MHIKNFLPKQITRTKKATGGERGSIIEEFVRNINIDRIDTKWKPTTPRLVAIKVGHLKTNEDLYYLLGMCNRAKAEPPKKKIIDGKEVWIKNTFSKCFYGSIKVK